MYSDASGIAFLIKRFEKKCRLYIYIYIYTSPNIYIYIGIQSLNLKLQLPPQRFPSPRNLERYFINNSSMHCDVNREKKNCTASLAKIPPETVTNAICDLYPCRTVLTVKNIGKIGSASRRSAGSRPAGGTGRHRRGCCRCWQRGEQPEGSQPSGAGI